MGISIQDFVSECLSATHHTQITAKNTMNTFKKTLALCGVTAALAFGSQQANAQDQGNRGGGRGNFDPAEMRQRQMERMREQFGVTNNDEWKIISERIEKVTEARRQAGAGGGFGFGRGGRGPGGPGGPGGGGQGGQGGGRGRGGFGPQSSPEAEALQQALDNNAGTDEVKAKLAKLREARKAGEEKLKVAQKDLKEVLNTKQEAVAVLMGLLP